MIPGHAGCPFSNKNVTDRWADMNQPIRCPSLMLHCEEHLKRHITQIHEKKYFNRHATDYWT
jgi:hypothetical protein